MIIRPPPWTVWVDSIVSKVLSIINLIGRGNYTYHTINSYIMYEVWKKYDGQLIIPLSPKAVWTNDLLSLPILYLQSK